MGGRRNNKTPSTDIKIRKYKRRRRGSADLPSICFPAAAAAAAGVIAILEAFEAAAAAWAWAAATAALLDVCWDW